MVVVVNEDATSSFRPIEISSPLFVVFRRYRSRGRVLIGRELSCQRST
jgi:hypothetical protein